MTDPLTSSGGVDFVRTPDERFAQVPDFLDAVALPPATLFAQDWGGLIGLRVATNDTTRFDRIAIGNTGLPIGRSIGDGFDRWLETSQTMEWPRTSRPGRSSTDWRSRY